MTFYKVLYKLVKQQTVLFLLIRTFKEYLIKKVCVMKWRRVKLDNNLSCVCQYSVFLIPRAFRGGKLPGLNFDKAEMNLFKS